MSRGHAWVALAAVAMVGVRAQAGPLDPPAGPIEPTMKRLDQLEPRRCLNDLKGSPDAVFVIADPGHYYLSADIQGDAGRHGIQIICPGDVSIDLNGFSLTGAPGSLDGIHCTDGGGSGGRVVVRGWDPKQKKAIVSGWGGNGIHCDGAFVCDVEGVAVRACDGNGVLCGNTEHFRCVSVEVDDCGGAGVLSLECRGVVHRDIAARNCLLSGIERRRAGQGAFGVVYRSSFERCVVDACGGNGIFVACPDDGEEVSVSSSSSSSCGGHGVCMLLSPPGGGGGGAGGLIRVDGLVCIGNGQDGWHISIPDGSRTSWRGAEVAVKRNAANGMAFLVSGATGTHAGTLSYVGPCDASENGEAGIVSENPIHVDKGNVTNNPLFGARVSGNDPYSLQGLFTSCVFQRNGGTSLHCSRGRYANVDCRITDGGGDGISLTEGCLLLTDSSVTHCVGDGVSVSGTLTVQSSVFRRNGGAGVRCADGSSVARDMVCELNGGGGAVFLDMSTVTLERCVFNDNTGDGVACSSTVGPTKWMAPECIASRNSDDGFDIGDCVGAELVDCVAVGNTTLGVRVRGTVATGRIERCSATGNGGGILVNGQGNLVVGNSASFGPLGAITIGPGNVAGPLIDAAGVATDCNPRANIVH